MAENTGQIIERLNRAIRRRDEALQRAADLAAAWEGRAASDRRYAENVPEDLRDDFLDATADWEHKARLVRQAITLTD